MKRIYLDHAAATPVDSRVLTRMEPFWAEVFGNAGAIHEEGVLAKKALDQSRKTIATELGVNSDEIIFTGSATESINLALRGSISAWKKLHPNQTPHLIISEIEHSAVLESAVLLEQEGVRVTRLPVDELGLVSLPSLSDALSEDTVLVSVMYANNEIGTIQPISDIAKLLRKWKKEVRGVTRERKPEGDERYPLLHTDACQATNYLPLRVPSLGVDLLTLNAAKIYGPKGVAILYVAREVPLESLIVGGGHERGRRAGTENIPLIVGLEEALVMACEIRDVESTRLRTLRDNAHALLLHTFPDIIMNGDRAHQLPNTLNVTFPGVDHEFLALALDARGIAVSTKSACNEFDAEISHVLRALRSASGSTAPASGLRITLGRGTTEEDVGTLVHTLEEIKLKMIY